MWSAICYYFYLLLIGHLHIVCPQLVCTNIITIYNDRFELLNFDLDVKDDSISMKIVSSFTYKWRDYQMKQTTKIITRIGTYVWPRRQQNCAAYKTNVSQ